MRIFTSFIRRGSAGAAPFNLEFFRGENFAAAVRQRVALQFGTTDGNVIIGESGEVWMEAPGATLDRKLEMLASGVVLQCELANG